MPRKQKRSMVRVKEGIYRRPSGKYVVPVYNPDTAGKTYIGPGVPRGGFDSLDEAERYKAKVKVSAGRNGQRKKQTETCDEFANRWVEDFPGGAGGKARAPQTKVHNRERMRQFARDFAGVPLDGGISRAAAHAWAVDHPNHLKAVRSMFTDAARVGLVHENPFAKLGIPESKGRKGSNITLLTEEEIAQLAECARIRWGTYGEETFAPVILTAAWTGLRPGELYALQWARVDFENDVIQVRRSVAQATGTEGLPKRERIRDVGMLPQARAALKRVPQVGKYVFLNQEGNQLRQRTHHYYWSQVRAMFWGGLPSHRQEEIDPGFDFYELRHFYGTFLATVLRLQPHEIADQMGHGDGGRQAYETYIHVDNKAVRKRIADVVRDAALG